MSKVVDFSTFQAQSFTVCLRQFYRRLDKTSIAAHQTMEYRKNFFIKIRGEFLNISRKKKSFSTEDAAQYLGSSATFIEEIEEGLVPVTDRHFAKLCTYYGTFKEAFILTEKIEKALNPELRLARKKIAKDLQRYGFSFEDNEGQR